MEETGVEPSLLQALIKPAKLKKSLQQNEEVLVLNKAVEPRKTLKIWSGKSVITHNFE